MDMEMNAEMEKDGGSESGEASYEGSSAGSVYCSLEQDYAKIIGEMQNNESLAPYKAEYTRLFEALYQAQKLEEELTEKVREQELDLEHFQKTVTNLEKQVGENEETILQTRQEVEEAKKLADASHIREQNAQEVIENLRVSIAKLNREIEQKNKQMTIDEAPVIEKKKDDAAKERDRLITEVEALKLRIRNITTYKDDLEMKNNTLENQLSSLQEKFDKLNNDLNKEKKERERAFQDIENFQRDIQIAHQELKDAEEVKKSLVSNNARLENLVKEKSIEYDKSQKEIQKYMHKTMSLGVDIQKMTMMHDETLKLLEERKKDITELNKQLRDMKIELENVRKERDLTLKKLSQESAKTYKMKENYYRTKAALESCELEILSLKKQYSEEKKQLEKITRAKDIAVKKASSLEELNKQISLELSIYEQNVRKANITIDELTHSANELKRHITNLENERDRCQKESKELTLQVEDYIDEVKAMRHEITVCKKSLVEADAKFRQQMSVFEEVRAERNSLKKTLNAAQEEILELKNKIRDLNINSDKLKDQVAAKEALLLKQEFLFTKKEKELDTLKTELQNSQKGISNLRSEINEMKQEEKHLNNSLREADVKISKLNKEIESLMSERDIIGTQIIRRNDELSLQYQRIQIINDSLNRGEKELAHKMEEIKLLKLENKKLQIDKSALERNTATLGNLRGEVFHLERNLTKERLKVVALEEEVENPLNIHRWRYLEGTDPDTYALLKKIQFLQKRIIHMSSELITKEKKIIDTEKVYKNLREILMKQPGPEVIEHLHAAKTALRDRGKKIKCLVAELNMNMNSDNESKVEDLVAELNTYKKKYFNLKRRSLKWVQNEPKPKDDSINNEKFGEEILSESKTKKKILGGGFNMSQSAPPLRTIKE